MRVPLQNALVKKCTHVKANIIFGALEELNGENAI